MRLAAGVLAISFWATAVAAADIGTLSEAEFDAQFRCPETIMDEGERSQAVADFVHWSKTRHPDWTVMNLVEARIALLKKHNCTETLKTIPNAAKS